MITLTGVTKAYPTRSGTHVVLNDITAVFPHRENIGIVGRNGAGKSTLMRILSGMEPPDDGQVDRIGRISWPLGFAGGFNSSLSGEENCRFVARIYDEDVERVTAFAFEFAELGEFFFMPVRTYSSGMRARLAFGVSMAIDFECYLVDEVTAVGDRSFKKKCKRAFAERRERSGMIMVSHDPSTIRDYCERCALLNEGKLTFYDSVDEAANDYEI